MKEKMKQQLKELDQKQQDFVQRIGEARDLLAELMFTSDAFFTLQKRELLHHMTSSCEHENRYTKEEIIFCNDCGNTLGFVEEDIHEPPFNYDLERMKEAVESPTVLTLTGERSQEEIRELLLKATDELDNKDIPAPPKQPIPPLARILKEGVLPPIPEIKKINYCPYLDGGFCYAKDNIVTNAINSGCFNPQECPANQG